MKRVLCIANDIPLPANSGGRVDVWRRLQSLKAAGHELALLCWIDVGRVEPPSAAVLAALREVCAEVRIVPITRSASEVLRRLLLLWRWPSHVASRWVTARPFSDLLAWGHRFAPDLVLLDGLYGGAVAQELTRALCLPLLYRSHNVEHLYMAGQRQRERRLVRRLGLVANSLGLRRFERQLISQARQVLDISPEDAAFWHAQGYAHVAWVPTLVDAEFARRLLQASAVKHYEILYFGNLNTANNVEALDWLVRQVLPLVPQAGLRIAVAGSRPTSAVRSLLASDTRITLIENPEDMAAVVAEARVLVNPMQSGSGVNLKSVEMLFSDAGLVSTSVGVKGLPEIAKQCFTVVDTPQAFATAIDEALRSGGVTTERTEPRRLFTAHSLLAVIDTATSQTLPMAFAGEVQHK